MILYDLNKENDRASKISNLMFRLYIASLSDVDVENWPKLVNATISTNVLKPGKVYRYLDVLASSINPNTAPGESPLTGVITIDAIIEGLSKATLGWLYNYQGEDVVLIWERCSDGQKFLGGSICSNGLTIKLGSIGKQDGGKNGISIQFMGGECTEPFAFYDGPIPRVAPTAVTVAAGKITLTDASAYIVKDNAAATTLTDIDGVTDSDVGRVIELSGAGVDFPATISSDAKFSLSGNLSFSLSVGNTISLLITKSGASYRFVEVHRS